MTEFRARLERAWQRTGNALCAGIDPQVERLPEIFGRGAAAIEPWGCAFIDAIAPLAAAVKFQIAHFAAVAAEPALEALVRHVRSVDPDLLVILDAKRGDIGATAERYAAEAYDRYGADAVTVNPYLGFDTLAPYLDRTDHGTIVLCHTSNLGAPVIQGVPAGGGSALYLRVAAEAAARNAHGNVMLVVGATHVHAIERVRAVAPDVALLVPGVGAQGGDAAAVMATGTDSRGRGLLVSVSRGLQPTDATDSVAAWQRQITTIASDYAARLAFDT